MSLRKKYIAGNWKMNKLSTEAASLAAEIVKGAKNAKCRILIAPPFTALSEVSRVVKETNVILGAQNMSNQKSGAHTGEISIDMLKDLGVGAVILGHSERRIIYGETDAFINSKVKLALSEKMEVILCVGETLEEREAGKAAEVVSKQVVNGLKDISETGLSLITIAYEPVWAIGTGKTATDKDADDVHAIIRQTLKDKYSAGSAEKMIIQYGGSVKAENAAGLLSMENIDGALVGGASLKAEQFLAIINSVK
ncbi:MAG: triose-phosphate isomerase [Spirochaetia bacterium]|jgi:triosephosphate isomerase|nr:triose-phosphate isomerase [Spirochaetia bacterium]